MIFFQEVQFISHCLIYLFWINICYEHLYQLIVIHIHLLYEEIKEIHSKVVFLRLICNINSSIDIGMNCYCCLLLEDYGRHSFQYNLFLCHWSCFLVIWSYYHQNSDVLIFLSHNRQKRIVYLISQIQWNLWHLRDFILVLIIISLFED